jgi:DNA modification methylase
MFTIAHGDCRDVMRAMESNSIDSIVTDPPYGLAFMGKEWDHGVPGVEFWTEALRVAKPGAHLLAFGGTRMYHRLTCAIEDAGWEIRDCIMWVYGSGFPKSLDVSKAIDKAAGAEREVVRESNTKNQKKSVSLKASKAHPEYGDRIPITAPATPDAAKWQGWGTALKPAWEPIIVARKPLSGTVAANVLEYGTGGINVDGCRVGRDAGDASGWSASGSKAGENRAMSGANYDREPKPDASGRWPANVIHDGSDEVVELFPETKSGKMGPWNNRTTDGSPNGIYHKFDVEHPLGETYGHSGSAARFFYCAKASKVDRGEGNHHPTVKPTDLMRYLCRLVTPPGGTVFDPFTGSGSTGKAAILEGFNFTGCDLSEEYVAIARARCEHSQNTMNSKLL